MLMSHSLATSNLVLAQEPTKQQLTDYANAVAKVNNYAYAITQTSLPILNRPPQNYADFTSEFAPAKAHAINWSDSIFPQMLALPQTILNAQALFSLDDTEVSQYLELLKKDPGNAQYKQGLEAALTAMQQLVKGQFDSVQTIESGLTTFATHIEADASSLNDIATKSLEDVGADKDLIDSLNAHIDQLNDEINSLQNWLTVSEIGIGLSIFIGCIGAVVAFVPGAQTAGIAIIVFGVVGTAASIAGTIIINKEIEADQDVIDADRNEISELNQDISALQGVNKQFEYLVTANEEAQQALAVIKQMWSELDAALTEVKTELTDVDTDVSSEQYDQALTDLQQAEAAWAEVVDFANALKGIVYQWQDKDGNWHDVSSTPPQADGAKVSTIGQAA